MSTRTQVSVSALPFVADRDSLMHDTGGTINWASVPASFQSTPEITQTVKATGTNAANAVALTVEALAYAVPSGTTLHFGSKQFATTTAAAAVGATSLTVEALPTAISAAETAVHVVQAGAGAKFIPAGWPMNDGSDGKTAMVPANTTNAKVLLATNAFEDSSTDALTGYGKIRGGVVFENLLPVTLDANAKTALSRFSFVQYSDSTTA